MSPHTPPTSIKHRILAADSLEDVVMVYGTQPAEHGTLVTMSAPNSSKKPWLIPKHCLSMSEGQGGEKHRVHEQWNKDGCRPAEQDGKR